MFSIVNTVGPVFFFNILVASCLQLHFLWGLYLRFYQYIMLNPQQWHRFYEADQPVTHLTHSAIAAMGGLLDKPLKEKGIETGGTLTNPMDKMAYVSRNQNPGYIATENGPFEDCYVSLSLEFQTTNPNHQATISWWNHQD